MPFGQKNSRFSAVFSRFSFLHFFHQNNKCSNDKLSTCVSHDEKSVGSFPNKRTNKCLFSLTFGENTNGLTKILDNIRIFELKYITYGWFHWLREEILFISKFTLKCFNSLSMRIYFKGD